MRAVGARRGVLRVLYLLPVLALLATGGVAVGRHRLDQAALADRYAAAAAAAAAGRYEEAVAGFTAAAGYRDADARRAEAAAVLAPYRSAYLDGIAALDAGRFDDAIAALLPVARDLPRYEDVTARLADARRLRADELRRRAGAAEARRDWPEVERALVALAAADPGDPEVEAKLAAFRREHAPMVLARDRALFLVSPDGGDAELLTDAVPALWPAWSPDRSRVAFLSLDPAGSPGDVALYVVNADGSGLTRLADRLSAHTPPVWSPDGSRLAYTSFAAFDRAREQGVIGVRVVEVATGRETDLSGPGLPIAINPSWSPTGDRVAFVSKERPRGESVQNAAGDVMVATLATGDHVNLTEGRIRDAWSVAWSPTEDRLLVFTLYGQTWYEPAQTGLRLLDARTGEDEPVETATTHVSPPSWAPDGTRFAFLDGETTVRIRGDDLPEVTIEAASKLSGELAWAPGGEALLAVAYDPADPSLMIPVGEGTGPAKTVPLDFDFENPFYGPPQWAPIRAPVTAGPPSIAGTGLDHDED